MRHCRKCLPPAAVAGADIDERDADPHAELRRQTREQ
jgi:hypothetical protein